MKTHIDERPLRILIVEDDPDVRLITRLSLTRIGNMLVTEANSGREAINKVASEKYDVILLDVMMPEMDGATTLRTMRNLPNGTTTPIIFLTAKVLPSEIERLQVLSTYEVITKPFDPLTLGDELQRIVRQHMMTEIPNEQHDTSN